MGGFLGNLRKRGGNSFGLVAISGDLVVTRSGFCAGTGATWVVLTKL